MEIGDINITASGFATSCMANCMVLWTRYFITAIAYPNHMTVIKVCIYVCMYICAYVYLLPPSKYYTHII